MSMQIGLHGGYCCGIKTIHGFNTHPEEFVRDKVETSTGYLHSDRTGDGFHSSFDFFWEPAPRETAVNRLDRYIKYIERVRHYGLVEAVLAVPTEHACDSLEGYTVDLLESGELDSFDQALDELGDEDDFTEGGYETGYQQEEWIPVLEERGFKEVSRFPNINSGNEVAVFHLVMDPDYYRSKKGK